MKSDDERWEEWKQADRLLLRLLGPPILVFLAVAVGLPLVMLLLIAVFVFHAWPLGVLAVLAWIGFVRWTRRQ